MELKEYIQIIFKHLPMIILITFLFGLASGLISIFVLDDVYQASSSIIVSDKKDNKNDISNNDIILYRNLVDTYSEVAKSNRVLLSVKEALKTDMSTQDLRGKITVSGVGDTEIIKIQVEDKNPEQAALIANTLAVIFQAEVKELLLMENVQVLDEAQVPVTPVKPRILLNVVVAVFLGLMISIGIVFLMEYLDNTIKTPEQVERILNIPVIGSIPSYDMD